MPDNQWTGGCLCGTVRFRLASAPFDAVWCHCRTCQLNSGSPAMAFPTAPVADYVVEKGAGHLGVVRSSNFGHRKFCRKCGMQLLMQVDHQPEAVDFSIATLDHPEAIEPDFPIFHASRIPWAAAGDEKPRYDGFRPDTSGL